MKGLLLAFLIGGTMAVVLGCTPYRIEHRERPPFHRQASNQELPDEVVLDDGTVLRFSDQKVKHTGASVGTGDYLGAERINIREQSPDGKVTLRAFAPEHVLAHAKQGIRMREYRVLWDQLLAAETRRTYERSGKGYNDFVKFCEENRPQLMETFNRMGFGLFSPDVIQEAIGSDAFRYRLHPRLASQFEFTEFDVVREPSGQKWLMIR